jgi:hypothetical protein
VADSLRRASYRFQHGGPSFLRYSRPLSDASGNKTLRKRSLSHRPHRCCFNNLSGGLLGLLVEGQGKDVEKLLVLDLLVRLDLLEVNLRGATEHGEAVLGDGNGGEESADGLGIGRANDLVLADNATTDALDDTNLAGALVVKLTQREGESAELLLDLAESGAGAGALEAVGGLGPPVKGGAVGEGLDLAVTSADAHLDTPDLADLGHTVTPDTVTGCEDDLLVALNVVAVEFPDGGVLDEAAVVALGELLEEVGDPGLGEGLGGGGGLLLLLVGASGQKTRRHHCAEHELLGVVGSELEVGGAASDLAANNDGVADNGTEAIDLGTELYLHSLAGLEGGLGLLRVGHERGVGSDVCAGRNGARVGDTLDDALALVDLGDLLLEELVTLLADLNDLGALGAPSWRMSQSRKRDECVIFVGVPETAFRTFSEMVAAVLYLVRLYFESTLWLFRRGMGGRKVAHVSGLARV